MGGESDTAKMTPTAIVDLDALLLRLQARQTEIDAELASLLDTQLSCEITAGRLLAQLRDETSTTLTVVPSLLARFKHKTTDDCVAALFKGHQPLLHPVSRLCCREPLEGRASCSCQTPTGGFYDFDRERATMKVVEEVLTSIRTVVNQFRLSATCQVSGKTDKLVQRLRKVEQALKERNQQIGETLNRIRDKHIRSETTAGTLFRDLRHLTVQVLDSNLELKALLDEGRLSSSECLTRVVDEQCERDQVEGDFYCVVNQDVTNHPITVACCNQTFDWEILQASFKARNTCPHCNTDSSGLQSLYNFTREQEILGVVKRTIDHLKNEVYGPFLRDHPYFVLVDYYPPLGRLNITHEQATKSEESVGRIIFLDPSQQRRITSLVLSLSDWGAKSVYDRRNLHPDYSKALTFDPEQNRYQLTDGKASERTVKVVLDDLDACSSVFNHVMLLGCQDEPKAHAQRVANGLASLHGAVLYHSGGDKEGFSSRCEQLAALAFGFSQSLGSEIRIHEE